MGPTKKPTAAPTTSPPTKKPTAAPTTSPTTKKPTAAPTTSPPTKKPTVTAPTSIFDPPTICGVDNDECTNDINSCCSDYKCVGNQYYKRCELKQSATCLPRWADCTNNVDGCCEGNVCLGNNYYKQCLKRTTTSPQTEKPTEKPTEAPTTSPPTKKPTEAPTAPVTDIEKPTSDKTKYSASGAKGDPHFKLWDGEAYDFHGICDLVLLHNPEFNNGLGMDIHIRTKKMKHWSYIKTAVISIGNESFEVMAERKHNYYWNNRIAGDEEIYTMTELPATISGYNIQFRKINSQQLEYTIVIGNNKNNNNNEKNKKKTNEIKTKNKKDKEEKIVFKTWNNFVRVDVINPTYENFKHSVGLMGTFVESAKMGRDNTTVIDDLNLFGQEWQVLPSEPKLFHNLDGPQAPAKCEIPSKIDLRRRLAESNINRKSAELACSHILQQDEFNLCVFDVIATSDENVAAAY